MYIRADTVVVTASAYGSPAILLRSGITELPVGANLADHVGTGMAWEPTDALRRDWDEWTREHVLSHYSDTEALAAFTHIAREQGGGAG